jgi:cytochrome P450
VSTAPGGPVGDQPFVPDDPLGWFDAARESAPVLWHPPTSSWYVTRFADVWRLLVDPRLAARSPDAFLQEMSEDQRVAVDPLVRFLSRWPMFLDPPRHTVGRRTLRSAFAPHEVKRTAAAVRAGFPAGGVPLAAGDDLLCSLLRPACERALGQLLGVPETDLRQLAHWSDQLMGFVSRRLFDLDMIAEANQALAEFTRFVERAYSATASPLAEAVAAEVRNGGFTPVDAVASYAQLVTGALEPTVAALAVALETVTQDHARRQDYAADPGAFAAEAFRVATPFHFAARRATTDIPLYGEVIPEGSRVVMVLVAANRDSRRYPEPTSFRLDRPAPHVAFGRGRHACLGASVAEQILRAVLDAVLAAAPTLPPVQARWSVSMGMRALLGVTVGTR